MKGKMLKWGTIVGELLLVGDLLQSKFRMAGLVQLFKAKLMKS